MHMTDGNVEVRRICISVMRHRTTGLLIASSHDMSGLLVSGRTEDELKERIPLVVRSLLEAQGCNVLSVSADDDELPRDFVTASLVASARLSRGLLSCRQ